MKSDRQARLWTCLMYSMRNIWKAIGSKTSQISKLPRLAVASSTLYFGKLTAQKYELRWVVKSKHKGGNKTENELVLWYQVAQARQFSSWFPACDWGCGNFVCSLQAQWSQRRRFRKPSSFTRCTSNRLCSMKKAGGKSLRYTKTFSAVSLSDWLTESHSSSYII